VSILGNRVLRKEDPKFLTVGGSYVDDLTIEGAARLVYVRSTMAHARITGIDVAAAKEAPGVLDVVTAADLDVGPVAPGIPIINQAMPEPVLANGVVRYVGEPVAAVVAETRAQAADAAELVVVDYDPLPVVADPERSVANETLLFPEAETNVALELAFGRDDHLFDDSEVVVRQRIVNQRLAPCPLEVRASAARWEPDGRVTFWASTQAPFGVRGGLAGLLGIGEDQIQVLSPDVGGGFGAKGQPYPEELFVAWLAKRLGRPVRWVETRSESMMALGQGRAQVQQVELGGSRDGKLQAYRLEVVQDCGAYPILGTILPTLTRTMMCGTYDIPKVEFNGQSVVTNTTPITSYRGAGRPEATAAIERAIDLFATEIGMDPAEVRRRNLVAADAFPYTTTVGTTYDVGNYPRALELVLEAGDYRSLREEQARRRQAGDRLQLGIGLSVYVEITNGIPGSEYGSVEIFPDGHVLVRTGTSPHGQGHATAWSMLVSEATGIPLDDIEVIHGDTDVVPRGIGTFGSRSLQTGGVAAGQAAAKVVEMARQLAAELLEADPADVVLDRVGQRFHVAGAPARAQSWTDLAREAKERGESLMAEVDFTPPGPTFPFGAHLAVAEVDVDTGRVRLVRMVAVDDAGRLLNPLLAEGQVHGGIAQGVAQALLEEVSYDSEGNPLTSNLADYSFISAAELPSFETVHMETPTPNNELGAKGIGESGTIGSTPAVQNAVVDAVSHLGVRHIDMPTTAERVWRALSDARSSAPR
jgi:aerobic carbon-monoxide dehydrogenase large subunit